MSNPISPGLRRIVEIVQALGFGTIEQLSIRNGSPCFDLAPRIVQHVKLGSESRPGCDPERESVAAKKEFTHLFNELRRIGDGVVDIEIRHSLPFRLILERRHTDFCAGESES